jgi:hypothetical protein
MLATSLRRKAAIRGGLRDLRQRLGRFARPENELPADGTTPPERVVEKQNVCRGAGQTPWE